ncbi:hypothetical protein YB2330_003748 [Saitoella coloradoensis]
MGVSPDDLIKSTLKNGLDKLSPEEKRVLEKSALVMSTYTKIGAATGLFVLGLSTRRLKNTTRLRVLGTCLFGMFAGGQVGLMVGVYQSSNIIRALPDQQHLISVLNETQAEIARGIKAPRSSAVGGSPSGRIPPLEVRGGNGNEFEQVPDADDGRILSDEEMNRQMMLLEQQRLANANGADGVGPIPVEQGQPQSAWTQARTQQQPEPRTRTQKWDEIRQAQTGQSQTAWARVRQEAATSSPSSSSSKSGSEPFGQGAYSYSAKLEEENLAREKGMEDFEKVLESERAASARTGEDRYAGAGFGGRKKVNQYGDES